MSSSSRFVPPSSKTGRSSAGSGGPQASKRIAGLPTQAGAAAGGAAGGGGGSSKNNVQVIHSGRIVTPQSLLSKKAGFVKPPDIPEFFIAAPKPREFTAISETVPSSAAPSGSTLPTIGDKLSVASVLSKKQVNMPGSKRAFAAKGGRVASAAEEKTVTEEMVYVNLCETDTEIVFSLKSFVVANESREATLAEERNSGYEANVEKHKNKDAFASRPAQTINNPLKNQNEMATPNSTAEMGCSVFSYEIKDAMDSLNSATDQNVAGFVSAGSGVSEREKISELTPFVHQSIVDTVTVASITPGCLLDTTEIHRPSAPQERRGGIKKTHDSSKKNMNTMTSGADTSNSTPHNNSGTTLNTGAGGADKDSGTESKELGTTPTESKASLGLQSQSDTGMSSHADDFSRAGGKQKDEEPVRAIDSAAVLRRKRADEILGSKSILKKLHMLERAVQQNAYRDNMLLYRDTPKVESLTFASATSNQANENANSLFGGGLGSRFGNLLSSAVLGGKEFTETDRTDAAAEDTNDASRKVQKLFTYFSSELSKGRAVTSMAWSAINPDLLAVGYGKYVHDPSLQEAIKTVAAAEQNSGGSIANLAAAVAQANEMSGAMGDQALVAPVLHEVDPSLLEPSCENEENGGGLVLFWSLRNPDYPEKFFHTPYPVTALDFSSVSPAILAVGMYSGDVAIYDVRREHDWGKPLESAEGTSGGHSEPVWQLKWLVKGQERVETLVSISTDGNVLEWSFKKGIVVSLLMQLQRTGVGEGWISRQAAGMCFDFCPSDPTVYVAGSEEGQIHKCSVSYSEQYLDTFEPHYGPVYKLKFSPHYHNVFLSCSADWSIGLYDLQKRPPIVNMHSTGQDFSVNDICWCPGNSTVFAAVTSDAKLQIWDLSVSNIDPVVVLDTAADFAESPGGIIENNFKEAVQNALTTVAQINTTYSTLQRKAGIGAALRKANVNGGKNNSEDDKQDTSSEGGNLTKLVKNLSTGPGPRALTTVLFGVKSPVIAVGDNRGTVIVYRVIEPVTVSHEPLSVQTARLQRALGQKSLGAEIAGAETSASSQNNGGGDAGLAGVAVEESVGLESQKEDEDAATLATEEDDRSLASNG